MLDCKDCCLFDTDACRYGNYVFGHDMSLNCDDSILEQIKGDKNDKSL